MDIQFIKSDGNLPSGYVGGNDCVVRSLVHISNRPYKQVYTECFNLNKWFWESYYVGYGVCKNYCPDYSGVQVRHYKFQEYMFNKFGLVKVPIISKTLHSFIKSKEILKYPFCIIPLTSHYTAIINGKLMDSWNCSVRNYRISKYGYRKGYKDSRYVWSYKHFKE